MEALIASYGDSSSDSDSESPAPRPELKNSEESSSALPPPPLSLLNSPNSFGNYKLQSIFSLFDLFWYGFEFSIVLSTKCLMF